MKSILTVCGVGFASSTIMAERIKNLLEREGLDKDVRIIQGTFNEVEGYLDSTDLIVTSSLMQGDFPIPVLNGVPFLSGIGMEELEIKILDIIR